MLAIARAVLRNPRLLMLDEPSLGLAPLVARAVYDALIQISQLGTTILLAEQNAKLALKIAHYGYILESGRIVLEGSSKDLMENESVQELYLGMAERRLLRKDGASTRRGGHGDLKRAETIPDLFLEQANRSKDRLALRHKKFGVWHRTSWKEYSEKVNQVAAGLISLGLSRGECVTLLGTNRPEWLICHLAVMTAGEPRVVSIHVRSGADPLCDRTFRVQNSFRGERRTGR